MNMDDDLRRKLAFVAPQRRKEVERRLAVLLRYCAIKHPSISEVDAAAAELGMSRGGFYRLVAVWMRTHDPANLERVSGATEKLWREKRHDERFIRHAFSQLPAGRVLERDLQDVKGAAQEAGVALRGEAALRRLLGELRGARDVAARPALGMVLEHVALELPVDGGIGEKPVMPIATVIAQMRMRAIVSVRLDLYTPSPTSNAAAIARAAAADSFAPDPDAPSVLTFVRGRDDGWDRLERDLLVAGVIREGERARTIRGGGLAGPLVFPTLLGITTRPGIVSRPMASRRAKVRARGDSVLSLEEAQRLVDERIPYARPPGTMPFSADPALLKRLMA
jgi:hypothetical protein